MAAPSDAEKYVAEFVGTFMLVATVGFVVLNPIATGAWGVTAIASTLMVMIYALGGISGGHFNPAVSMALLVAKKIEVKTAGIYMVCQLVGGVVAALAVQHGLGGGTLDLAPNEAKYQWWQFGIAEFLYTFMLCFVVLNVATSKDAGNQYYGMAIGFVVVAGGYGAGSISGGCFNPAVALGLDICNNGIKWSPVYFAFEFLGAIAAAGAFQVVRAHEESEGTPASVVSKLLSEFLGTYFLVLTVGLNVLGGSGAAVLSIASSLMCMIYALGSVSGGNFNPAVSLCLVIRKALPLKDAGTYMVVQLLGGITAGCTYAVLEGSKGFSLGPKTGHNIVQVAFAEILFTFLLCYVVCCVATIRNPLSQYFGLAIGFCVTAGGVASGGISGGSLNPAVSCGIAISDVAFGGHGDVMNAVYYSLFEFIGGALAAGLFLFTHATTEIKRDMDECLLA